MTLEPLQLFSLDLDGEGARPEFYTVGPFGDRVNFAFQQRRALCLASLLSRRHAESKGNSNFRIAVLGGGIAGVTISIGLRNVGFTNIRLFEKNTDVLCQYVDARHRYIHPGYSDWPKEHSCYATTDFPFLNWHCGSAKEVAQQIYSEWIEAQEALDPEVVVSPGRKVIQVRESTREETTTNKIVVLHEKSETGSNRTPNFFDLVIATMGFGDDTHTEYSDAESYWESDKTKQYHTRIDKYGESIFEISGTGDGGLIDCARIGLNYGENGELPIRIISYLRSEKYRKPPENGCSEKPKLSKFEQELFEEENAIRNLPGTEVEKSEKLRDLYLRTIEEMKSFAPAAYKLLDDICREDMLERLVICGRGVSPFEIRTAPINKLVVAFLLSKNGELFTLRESHPRIPDDGTRDGDLGESRETNPEQDNTIAIIRHGAKPPVLEVWQGTMPKHSDVGDLYNRLSAEFSNHAEFEVDDNEFAPTLDKNSELDDASEGYKTYRRNLAEKFARKFFPNFSTGAVSLEEDQSGRSVLIFDRKGRDMDETAFEPLGGFDRQVFGVPVEFRSTEGQMQTQPKRDIS